MSLELPDRRLRGEVPEGHDLVEPGREELSAVGGEGDRRHMGLGMGEHDVLAGLGHVPEPDLSSSPGRGQQGAGSVEGDRPDPLRVPEQPVTLGDRRPIHVPEDDHTAEPGRGERPAVGAEGHVVDRAGVGVGDLMKQGPG